jgi:hypothetical protein
MVEFHVESSESLDMWRATTSFGGHLSVRRLPCQPVLFYFGQDESVYSPESAASRHWVVDGKSILTQKSGISLMVSGLTSGELSFGLTLTAEQLEAVNDRRRRPENNTYVFGKYGAPQALFGLGVVPESDKKPKPEGVAGHPQHFQLQGWGRVLGLVAHDGEDGGRGGRRQGAVPVGADRRGVRPLGRPRDPEEGCL